MSLPAPMVAPPLAAGTTAELSSECVLVHDDGPFDLLSRRSACTSVQTCRPTPCHSRLPLMPQSKRLHCRKELNTVAGSNALCCEARVSFRGVQVHCRVLRITTRMDNRPIIYHLHSATRLPPYKLLTTAAHAMTVTPKRILSSSALCPCDNCCHCH